MNPEEFWTRARLLQHATTRLRSCHVTDPVRNAEWMLCEVLNCSRAQLYAYPEASVEDAVAQTVDQMLDRRCAHEPLQYILGYTDFYGLRFEVNSSVLIPRPETELLVEEALNRLAPIKNPSILDIGTGSGCIALSLKYHKPDANVYACDVSAEALSVAKRNAASLQQSVYFFKTDIFSGLPADLSPQLFDMFVSNPPYIPAEERDTLEAEVKDYEPGIALFVDTDPITYYRCIVALARDYLNAGGLLVFEIHADYAQPVLDVVHEKQFQNPALIKDLAGRPRIIIAQKPSV